MNPAEQPPAGPTLNFEALQAAVTESVAERDALRRAAYNAYAVLRIQRAIAFTTAFDSTIAELEEALGMTKKKAIDEKAEL